MIKDFRLAQRRLNFHLHAGFFEMSIHAKFRFFTKIPINKCVYICGYVLVDGFLQLGYLHLIKTNKKEP